MGRITFVIFVVLFFPILSNAQELRGDILWVYSGSNSTIFLPGDIKEFDLLCEDVFSVKRDGRKLIIKPITDQPPTAPCGLRVEEGSGATTRNHTFKLYLIPPDGAGSMDIDKTYIDIRTLDKLRARVATLSTGNNDPKPAMQAETPAAYTEPQQSVSNTTDESIDLDGTKIKISQLNRQVQERLKAYYDNLQLLALENPPAPASAIIKRIMTFFNNNISRKVSIKNGNKPIVTKPIMEYLNRVSMLRYKNVKIESSNMEFVGKFEKNPDGTWWGVICFTQKFTANRENKKFVDETKKMARIQVKVTEMMKGGKMTNVVEVFIGDITMDEA